MGISVGIIAREYVARNQGVGSSVSLLNGVPESIDVPT
jgi:hypothetical protein